MTIPRRPAGYTPDALASDLRGFTDQLRYAMPTLNRIAKVLETRSPRYLTIADLQRRYLLGEEPIREIMRAAGMDTGGRGRALRYPVTGLQELDALVDEWTAKQHREASRELCKTG